MEERLRILKMLEQGKITSEEANKLLEIIDGKPDYSRGKTKWLKIKVIESGSQKVNVRIPFSLIKIAAKVGGKLNINLPDKVKEKLSEKGIELDNLGNGENVNDFLKELEKEAPFELVNVDDGDEKVIVIIE